VQREIPGGFALRMRNRYAPREQCRQDGTQYPLASA
jgi:hypothetical protein